MSKLLVTSALPYAAGPLHLGHLVEYIQTDVYVRSQKLFGRDVIYVCADDTHGTPIELAAQKRGIPPEQLIAEVYESHVRDFRDFGIGFDEYGSTHTDENRHFAELIFERLAKGGHIEKRPLELTYCETDKRFLPDRFVRGICPRCGAADQYGDVCEVCKSTYEPTELKEPRCAICGNPPVRRASEHYFFKLSDFATYLSHVAHGEEKPHLDGQVLNYLKGWTDPGLRDWCISRDGPYFGFRIPGSPDKYFYVWLDAPIGYLSNTERLMKKRGSSAAAYWAPDADASIVHFIGKDIIYFHALFWPAMLKGAGFKVPSRIVVHGMLSVKGEKMSKSRGRPVNARAYLDAGLDPEQLRYYFAANLRATPTDIDLNVEDFKNRVNAELVNNLANFCHRTLSLLRSRFEGRLTTPSPDAKANELWAAVQTHVAAVQKWFGELEFAKAMAHIVEIGNAGNLFLQERKPWELGATAHGDLSLCANIACAIGVLLSPVTPRMARDVLAQLGLEGNGFADLKETPWIQSGTLRPGPAALMARVGPTQAAALAPDAPASPSAEKTTEKTIEPGKTIPFERFAEVELRCGLILEAKAVAGARKLLELTVDLGEGAPRTIASGIAESFAPDTLPGRRVVIVANLEVRKIRGIESRGMLLATGEGASLRLVSLPDDVPPGAVVR